MKKYFVLHGDFTQEEYKEFTNYQDALNYARDIKSYTTRKTLLKDYHIYISSSTTSVKDMEDWELVADLNPTTLDGFIEEVVYTVYEKATNDMDIVLKSGEIISIPFEELEDYIKDDDFTRKGYSYIYSYYKHYYNY